MMIARLVWRWSRLNGDTKAIEPSAMHAWAEARLQQYAGKDPAVVPPLVSVGVHADIAMDSARKKGFVRWDSWPWSPSLACVKPPPSVAARAFGARAFEYYQAFGLGQARVEAAAQAMTRRHTVGVCMLVDDAFMAHLGNGIVTHIDTRAAEGHAMSVLAIDFTRGAALLENWWEAWGNADGQAWVSLDLLGDPSVVPNIYAIRFAPGVTP
jgi:hypothetical protein